MTNVKYFKQFVLFLVVRSWHSSHSCRQIHSGKYRC